MFKVSINRFYTLYKKSKVVAGTPKELKVIQGNSIIKYAVIGIVVDKY